MNSIDHFDFSPVRNALSCIKLVLLSTHTGNGDDAEPAGPEAFLDPVAQVLVPLLRPAAAPSQVAKQHAVR